MKVKQEILDKIDNSVMRTRIAARLGTGGPNVYLAIKRNVDNGRMTKMDFLLAVSEELGIETNEILEDSEKAIA